MSIERIAGFTTILVGTMMMMKIEGMEIIPLLFAPSAWAIVFGITIGGTMISTNAAELRLLTQGLKSAFIHGVKYTEDELKIYQKLFDRLSRYSFAAGWFGLLVGIIHIFGSLEIFMETPDRNVGRLAGGLALASLAPLYGTFFSKFVFDPLKKYFEWEAAFLNKDVQHSINATQATAQVPTPRLIVKLVLFSSLTVVLLTVVVLVSWRISHMQSQYTAQQGADTTARVIKTTSFSTFFLGTRDHKAFDLVIHRNGQSHRINCTIWLSYSRAYDRRGPELFSELRDKTPAMREIVIRVLGNKTFDELKIENLDHIETEILSKINEILENGSIVDIAFSDYVLE